MLNVNYYINLYIYIYTYISNQHIIHKSLKSEYPVKCIVIIKINKNNITKKGTINGLVINAF